MGTYGYARVSTKEQNEDRQILALMGAGVSAGNIYVDKQSGKDFERAGYKKLLDRLGENDVLFIHSIDRLGRNYADLMEQWKLITKDKGADVVVLDMPILDTRREKGLLGTFISDLVLAILSYVAENERDAIRKRQGEGIEAARRRGVKFGRPKMPISPQVVELGKRWRNGELSMAEAASLCGLKPKTFYSRVAKWERENDVRLE